VNHSAEHSHKRPNYLLVFLGLLALTVIEVGITQLGIPDSIVVPSLLAFMLFKVVLVAMFYMHLRVDSRWFSYMFLIPLPFVALIMFILLVGYAK
jgi:caa(3)-type oxidase subunit IV